MKNCNPLYFYHPFTQFENLGDLVINRELLVELRRRGQLTVLRAGIPDDFWLGLNVSDSEVWQGRRGPFFLAMIASALLGTRPTYLITKPGDVLFLASHLSPWRGMLKAAALFLIKIFGVRICAVGISTNSKCFDSSYIERFAVRQVHGRIVRDSVSYREAKNFGGKLLLGSDLALNYERRAPDEQRDGRNKLVYISFRDPRDPDKVEDILVSLKSLKVSGKINLVPVYQVKHDLEFMQLLAQELCIESPIEIIQPEKQYMEAAFVVSNRLHVLLLAWQSGASPIALISEANIKIRGLFEDLSLEEFVFEEGFRLTMDVLPKMTRVKRDEQIERARNLLHSALDELLTP
jgi:polysaccharide pyruvyl transferase WcaK-like protein